MKFLHISDLHIGQPGARHTVQKLVDSIIKTEEKQVVLLTGDVTDDGLTSQYEDALSALKPLTLAGFLVLPVPGNHDVGVKGINYNVFTRARFDAFLHELTGPILYSKLYPYVYRIDGVQYVMCDSTVEGKNLAGGGLGYVQRNRIATELQQGKDAGLINVVALHHHPFDTGFGLKLHDWEQTLSSLSARCDVLCFGHKHEAGEWSGSWGIRRILAADKTTRSMRYRSVEINRETGRIDQAWREVSA